MAEEFNEEIICRGLAGLKDQRVGVFSRESFRPSGQELWPSVEGMELLPTHQRAFLQESDVVTFEVLFLFIFIFIFVLWSAFFVMYS